MQTVILIRHGYPLSWDQKLPVRGTEPHLRLDSPLADIGSRQAQLSANHIASGGTVSTILSSPFRRSLETADAISAVCGTAVVADWRLGEVLLSTVLGSVFSPNSAMDPEWAARRAKAGKPAHPESDRTIEERVAKVVVELKARKPFAQRIVIVSHDIILKHLINRMTGRAVSFDWHPCAMTTLVLPKPADRQWRLQGTPGNFQHLGADDRSEPVEQIVHKYHPMDSRS